VILLDTNLQSSQWLPYFQKRFTLLPDREDLLDRWHGLVMMRAVTGFRSHDARLVAAMQWLRRVTFADVQRR
jgi:hypothetical protein